MKSDETCDCELCLLVRKSKDEGWEEDRFEAEIVKITVLNCKKLEIPKCCGGCDNWICDEALLVGICKEMDKTKEPLTSGGDGKHCWHYKVVDQAKFLKNLKSCQERP